ADHDPADAPVGRQFARVDPSVNGADVDLHDPGRLDGEDGVLRYHGRHLRACSAPTSIRFRSKATAHDVMSIRWPAYFTVGSTTTGPPLPKGRQPRLA